MKKYIEACNNGRIHAVGQVGRILGTHNNQKYLYNNANGITIFIDDWGHYMTVYYRENLVCNTHYCQRIYLPGEWESIIENLLPMVIVAKHKYCLN